MKKTNVVSMSNWDKRHISEIISSSSEADEDIREHSQEYAPYKDLFTDVYASLYKQSVRLNDADEIRDSHMFNHSVMQNALVAPEYKSLHIKTIRDENASLLASMMFSRKLLEQVDEETKEAWSELDRIEKQLNYYESLMQELPKEKVQEQGIEDAVAKLKAKQQEIQQNINLDQAQNDILKAVNVAAEQVKEEVQEIQQASLSYGLEEGQGKRMSAKERFELARQIKHKKDLHLMAKWLGRLRRVARSTKRIERIPEEVVTVTNGNDLPQVLPSEFAYLNVGLSDLFYQKFAERQLLQFDMRKPEGDALGPFIIALDASGSMYGERDAFAKALAVAFIELGRVDKRDVWVIIFSAGNSFKTYHLDPFNYNPKTVIEIAELFLSGGTDFNIPVREAIQIMENDAKGRKADLLFLSDGEGAIDEIVANTFNRLKQENNSKALAVTIGGHSANVSKFCDKVVSHAQIGEGLAKEIYEWAVN